MQEIVIKIPEGTYKDIVKNGFIYDEDSEVVSHAIINGTVLPKGHGRLIDADYLKGVILLYNFHGNNKNIVPYADRRGYRLRQREVDEAIINSPTIIEADRSEE